jgi:hypothetical protein
MWRRLVVPVVVSLAVTGALASADDSPPERRPAAHAARAIELTQSDDCVRRSVRLNLNPPAGVMFASLSVRVRDDERLQLADLGGPGSIKLLLPSGKSRVSVSAATSAGDFLRTSRMYRRCTAADLRPDPQKTPEPGSPSPTPGPVTGGGED